MQMNKIGIGFLVMMAAATGLSAQDGLYVGAKGGMNMRNINERAYGKENNDRAFHDQEKDFSGGLTVGHRWDCVRVEGELAMHRSHNKELSNIDKRKLDLKSGREQFDSYAVMGNVIYDFQNESPLTPHLGVGVGMANIRHSQKGKITSQSTISREEEGETVTETISKTEKLNKKDSANRMAWQGLAGVNYALTNNIELSTDYQYYRDAKHHASHAVVVGLQHYF